MNVHHIIITTVKEEKQPRCLPDEEWIKEMWPGHTVEYYSAVKRSKVLTHVTTLSEPWKHDAE